MELKLLRSFIAVASHNNFSMAAQELNTVQPAISRHISELEDEIGYSLFWRNTREVKITESGKCLLKYAKDLIELEQLALINTIKAGKGDLGTIRIGHIGSASFTFLPSLIRKYSALHPDVEIFLYEMSVKKQLDAFKDDKIDIGISRKLPDLLNQSLHSKKLYKDQLYIVVPDSCERFNRERLDVRDLQNENFILFNREEAPVLFDSIIHECNKNHFTPKIIKQPISMQTVISEVASSLGVSIVPGCIRRLYTNGCRFIPLRSKETYIDTEIHYPVKNVSPAVRSFIDVTLDSLEEIRNNVSIDNR